MINPLQFTKDKLSNPLIRGSAIVLVGSLGGAFLNYLFHFVVGRLMTPAEYGVIVALFSIMYIVGVPGSILSTTAIKFAAQYKAREDFKAVTAALVWVTKVITVLGLAFFAIAFILRSPITHFLKLDDPWVVVFFFLYMGVSFLGSSWPGFLNGLLRFKAYAFVSVLGPFLKVVLCGLAAYLGYGVFGVIGGLIAFTLVTSVLVFGLLKKNLRFPYQQSEFDVRELLKFALPTAIITLSLMAFYNTDVLLVKHFFSPEEAGIYGSAIMLGRMILFGLGSISLVMFPMAAEKHANGGDPFKILKGSLGLVVLGALGGVGLYFLVPQLLVKILFGSQYLSAVPYLGTLAIFMALYAIVDLIARFFLSINNYRPAAVLAIGSLAQVGLLWIFHGSLNQVILVNIFVIGGVLSVLVVDLFRHGIRGARMGVE